MSEIAIPINRYVINVGVSFGCSCDCGSIQFLLASFERPTCIATETSTHPDMFRCQLLQIPDPMKSRRCEIVLLENLTRVSGCQEGSMLSSSIAAETHVKVRSNQIKYSPHAFENLYIRSYQILKQGLDPTDLAHYIYIHTHFIYIYM